MNGPPGVFPNPRLDVLVDGVDGRRRRSTTYSGTLRFGQVVQMGGAVVSGGTATRWQFGGPVFVPDGLPYGGPELASTTIAAQVWLASGAGDRSLVHRGEAIWQPDPRDPSRVWLALALDVVVTIGTALGYRVDVLALPEAVLGE